MTIIDKLTDLQLYACNVYSTRRYVLMISNRSNDLQSPNTSLSLYFTVN